MTRYRHPYSAHQAKEEMPLPCLLPNSALERTKRSREKNVCFGIVTGVASAPIVTNRLELGIVFSLCKMEGGEPRAR